MKTLKKVKNHIVKVFILCTIMNETNETSKEVIKVIIDDSDESDNESIQDEDVNVEYTIYDDIEYDNHSDEDADEREIALYNEMMDYTHDEGCVINDKISDIDDDECQYCNWNSNLPQSHVLYCIYCPIVVSVYDTYIDDDGEIFYTLKSNK